MYKTRDIVLDNSIPNIFVSRDIGFQKAYIDDTSY
jgi:hypothetical protein